MRKYEKGDHVLVPYVSYICGIHSVQNWMAGIVIEVLEGDYIRVELFETIDGEKKPIVKGSIVDRSR